MEIGTLEFLFLFGTVIALIVVMAIPSRDEHTISRRMARLEQRMAQLEAGHVPAEPAKERSALGKH